jgi:hypothetical protein
VIKSPNALPLSDLDDEKLFQLDTSASTTLRISKFDVCLLKRFERSESIELLERLELAAPSEWCARRDREENGDWCAASIIS